RVDVRIDDVRDAHILGLREAGVRLDVIDSRIDDRAGAQRAAAEEIRGATEVVVVEGAEDHRPSSCRRAFMRAGCQAPARSGTRRGATLETLPADAARDARSPAATRRRGRRR